MTVPNPKVVECTPIQKVIFIKTHKTGSTTTATLLQRFGYTRNLSFAVPKKSHIFNHTDLFSASMVYRIPNRARTHFDMLLNHARYNRKEMDDIVPRAKYISIIRNPVTQIESAFGYYEMAKILKIKSANPFETFIDNPEKYYERKKSMVLASEWTII